MIIDIINFMWKLLLSLDSYLNFFLFFLLPDSSTKPSTSSLSPSIETSFSDWASSSSPIYNELENDSHFANSNLTLVNGISKNSLMTSSWFLLTKLNIGAIQTSAKKLNTHDTDKNTTKMNPLFTELSIKFYV